MADLGTMPLEELIKQSGSPYPTYLSCPVERKDTEV